MRKRLVLFLVFIFSLIILINAKPYKPKPILLIHGIDGNSKCWGVSPKYVDTTYNNKIYNIAKDSIIKDSIIDGRILPVCLEKLLPMVWNWYNWEKNNNFNPSFTPSDTSSLIQEEYIRKAYPNKAFLEIVNFHDNNGSIDKPGNYWPIADRYNSPTYCCQAEELSNRIRSVLGEYYGTGPSDTSRTATWVNDTTAKLILVAHSMGNTTIHQAMIWDTMLVHHIHKHISVDGVNAGTWVATPGAGDLVYAYLMEHPLILLLSGIFNPIFNDWKAGITVGENGLNMNISSTLSIDWWNWGDMSTKRALFSIIGLPALLDIVRLGGAEELQPALRDLGKYSKCLNENREHSQAYIDGGAKFVSIVGDQFLGSDSKAFFNVQYNHIGGVVYGTGYPLLAYFFATEQWNNLIVGGISMINWTWFDFATDMWVDECGEDLNSLNHNFNSKHITIHNLQHSNSPHQVGAILKAVEDQPKVYIDSAAFAIKDTFGNIIGYEYRQFKENGIDTFPGQPSKIFGRIYDYFLANTQNTFAFNGQSEYGGAISFGRDPNTGNELGLNGNNFVIDSIDSDWLFTGVNKISVYSKNMLGEIALKRAKFFINGDYFVHNINPPMDHDISLDRAYGNNGTIWSDSLNDTLPLKMRLTSCSNIEDFKIYFDNQELDTYTNTLRDISEDYCAYITNQPSEGQHLVTVKFKIQANVNIIQVGWNLYVDNTKPYIRIIKPKSYKKYSQRVDSIMYINLETNDDSMQQYFPRSDSIILEIDSMIGSNFVNIYRMVDTTVTEMSYGSWHIYKWNYRDNNGNLVPSGEYRLKAYVYDHAGNGKDTSVIFIVDNDPPKLFVDVDEQLSPNPFTSNVNEMIMEYRTNEHNQFNVTYIDTSNISQKRYRQFIGDSTVDEYGNWEHYYYFEGESTQGSYLPDGVYNIILKGIDDAGNDTIYNPNVFLSNGPYLRVDRTSPEIINPIIMPYIAPKRDTTVNLRFILSEKRDVIVNRGIDTVRIIVHNNSDTIYTNTITSNPDIADSINIPISVGGSNAYGVYTADIYAKDRFGNSNHRKAIFIYGTIGAKITSPEQGDTIPKGFKSIMGYAGDPDMYNYYDFARYEIGYKKTGETQWQHNGIFVPEYRRGDSSYISILPANDTTVLAYWNTEGLTNGQYILNLKTFEETGNSLEYQHTVYIDTDILSTSPEIEYFNIEKIAGDTENRSRDDSIYNPANGDELEINYEIGKKISDVSIDISSNSFGNVYHKVINNVVPYKGEPLTSDQTGYYIYKENDLFYLKGYNSGDIGKMVDVSIKSLIPGDSIDLIEWEKIYNPNSPAGYRGSIDTPMVVIANIDNKLSAAGILPTKTGFIAKFSSNGNRYNISKGDNDSNVIYFGKDKVAFSGNVINLIENNREVWNLKKFGGANVHGGKYNIYISAVGTDGVGLADTTDFIIVRDSIEIQDVEITQSEVNPWAGIPAGLRFKLNEDGYVMVSVYKNTNKIATLLNGYFLSGNLIKDVSYYGNDSLIGGESLYFKISATNLDSTRTVEANSVNFSVSNVPANPDSDIYIPNNFFMGMIDNDSIFNGKGMYDFTSKYEALNNQPVLARGDLNICTEKDRTIKLYTKLYSHVDSILEGYTIITNTGQKKLLNYDTTSLGSNYNLFIKNLYYDAYNNSSYYCSTRNTNIPLAENYYINITPSKFNVDNDTLIIKVYNDEEYCQSYPNWVRHIYFRVFKNDTFYANRIDARNLIYSKSYEYESDLPTYSFKIGITYHKKVPRDSLYYIDTSDTYTLSFSSSSNSFSISKPYSARLDINALIDNNTYYNTNVEKDSTISCKGFSIIPAGVSQINISISPDTLEKDLWLDKNTYFIDTIITDSVDTINISQYNTDSLHTVYFKSYKNNILSSIDSAEKELILYNNLSSSQFDYFLPDSIIKKDCIQAYSSDFSAYGDKIYYKDYYNENIVDSLKLHLHFNMKKKSSDHKLHLNQIWKSPENSLSSLGIKKYFNISDTIVYGIEPNTEYKFIKNVRFHGNGNPNDTLRGNDPYATYKLFLKSDLDSIYIGKQNIDSIMIYSSEDWEYNKEFCINFNYSEEINAILDSIIGFGDIEDFEYKITGKLLKNNNTSLMSDSCEIYGCDSDTIFPLLGMNFFVEPSGNGIDLKFNPDSSYYKLFTSDNASNNYIKYTNWDVNICYPNGEIHRDLFLDNTLGNYHTDPNVGHGGDCYFQPEIYWTEKMPEDYVILKTNNSIKTKYKLYYIQDSTIHPVDSILYQPMGDEDSILGYWDIASVYGNVRLLVFQGDTNAIDSIKYKDFHIGNIIDTNNGGTASSPYKRATLAFPGGVFAGDTISKVVSIGFDTDNIGESSPYLGGNTGPVVKMYPMGKVFTDMGHCPTLSYHFTDREKINQNIDVNNISLFSIGNNGEIRRVNASVMTSYYDNDSNIIWTLKARPEEFPKDGEHNYYAPLKDSETVELGFDIKKVKSLPDNKIAILLKSVPVDTGVIIPDTITITFVIQNRDSTGSINLLEKLNIYDIKNDSSGRGTFTIISYDIPIGNFRDNDSLFIIDSVPDEYSKVFVYGNHIDTSRSENDTIRNSEVKTFYLEGGYSLNVNKDSLYINRSKTDTISIHCKKDMNIYYTLSDQYGNEIFNKRYSPENNGNMDIIWDGYIDNVPVNSGEYNAKIIIKDKDDYLVYSDNANWHIYFDYDLSISHPLSGIFKGDVTLLTFPLDVPPPVKWYIKYPSQAFEYYIGEENHSGDGFILDTREYSDGSNIWLIAEITDLYGFNGKDSVKITIDNSPPLISVIEEGVGYNTHYNSLIINCEFSDSLSGLAYCSYNLTFGNIPSRDNIPLDNPILVLDSDTLAEGGYTLSLSATDNMGNQTSKDVEFTIDRTPPEVIMRIKPKTFMKNDTVCVSHNGSISLDYIDVTDTDIFYKIEFEQQRFGVWQQYLDTIQLSDYCDNIDVYYKGTDKCGNASAEYFKILYVNHKIPETYISYFPYYEDAGVIYLSPESYITLESESTYVGTKGIYYKTTNQKNGFDEYTEPFKLANTGFNDVYFYSINNLDEREGINNRALYYDNITPSLDVNFIGYHQHSSDQTTIDTSTMIEFNTEETGSGIKNVLYQIGDTMCNYITPFKIQEIGQYDLITYINDNVGNIDIDTINLFVDEKTIKAEFYFEGSNYGQFVTGESKIGITVTDSGVGVSDILYSIDSCDYTAYNTPVDLHNIEEGGHCIKTLAIDSNNNSFTDSMLFTIDNSPPLISVIEEGVGYNTHYNSLIINCEFSDSLSGLANYSYNLTFGNIPARDNVPLENPILVLNSDTLAEGGYTLSLSATDNMGNQTSKDVEFTIDRSPPDVMIRIKPKIFMKNDTVCVSHNGSISLDYIDVTDTDIFYKIEFEQQRFGIWQQYEDTIQLSDYCDNIDVYYKGTDKCGNASAVYSRILYVNHKIPETYISYFPYYEDAGVIYLSPESYITLESESTYVGTKGIYYKTTNQKNGFNEYTEPFKLANTGFNDVYFYSVNNLDEKEGIKNRAFYYDNITPSLDVNFIGYHHYNNNGNQITIDTSTVIEFNTEETGSGIKNVLYQICDTMCNYSTPFKIQRKGKYHFITHINDNVGNIAIDTINLFVDEKTIKAEFYFEGSNYGQFVTGESKIGITVTDSGVGVSDILYSMDGEEYIKYSTPIDLYDMEEGSHSIAMRVMDLNGHPFEDFMFFTIDNSAPCISETVSGPNYITDSLLFINNNSDISVIFSDSISGIGGNSFRIDNGNWIITNDTLNLNFLYYPDGNHTIELKSYDNLKNSITDTLDICKDNNPPDDSLVLISGYYINNDILYFSDNGSFMLDSWDDYSGVDSVLWAYNNNGLVPYEEIITTAGLSNGENRLRVILKDNLGNTKENATLMVIDTDSPLIMYEFNGYSLYQNNAYTVYNTTKLIISFNDTISGIKENLCIIDYTDTLTVNNVFTFDFLNYPIGSHNLKFVSEDNVGNISELIFNISIVSSNLSGEFYIVGPNYMEYISMLSKIGITVTDSGAGVKDLKYKIDSEPYTDYQGLIEINSYQEGSHCIFMELSDSANTIFNDSVNFTIDKSVPLIDIDISEPYISNDSLTYINLVTNVRFLFSDSISGIKQNSYRVNNLDWANIGDTFDLDLSGFVDGYYDIEIRSSDYVDNVSYDTINLCLDNEAPLDSINPLSFYYKNDFLIYFNKNGTFEIDTWDEYSGVDSVKWAFDSDSLIPYTGIINVDGLEEGEHLLHIYTEDRLSNYSNDSMQLVIDTTIPAIIDTLIGDYTLIDSVIFVKDSTILRLIFEDTLSGIYENSCKINDFYTVYLPDTFEMDFSSFTEDYLTLDIQSEDNVGNINQINFVFGIDKTAPDVNVLYIGPNIEIFDTTVISGNSYIVIEASDNLSGVDSVLWKVDNDNYQIYNDTIGCDSFDEGSHILHIIAYDKLGNMQACENVFAIDKSAPEISINITGPNYCNNDTTFVNLSSGIVIEAQDNLAGVDSIFYSLTIDGSDYFVPFGDTIHIEGEDTTYILRYYAIDKIGNVSDTSISIFYLDNTPPSIEIYSPYDKTIMNNNIVDGKSRDEIIYYFYFRYRVEDREAILSKIYFKKAEADTLFVDSFNLSPIDSVKYDYYYTDTFFPSKDFSGIYSFLIMAEDRLGNSSVDTIYGEEGDPDYNVISGGFNYSSKICIRDNYVYVNNCSGNYKSAQKNKGFNKMLPGVYKLDFEGNIISSLPLYNVYNYDIEVDESENIYMKYVPFGECKRDIDTIAAKIDFNTGTIDVIAGSYDYYNILGIGLDSLKNIYVGMINWNERYTDSMRIDIFDNNLNYLSTYKFPIAGYAFDVNANGDIYISEEDTIANIYYMSRYIKNGLNYEKDTSFRVEYDNHFIVSFVTDSLNTIYGVEDVNNTRYISIVYPVYNFNNQWGYYKGYYRYIGNNFVYDFARSGDDLFYIDNDLHRLHIPFDSRKANVKNGDLGRDGEKFSIGTFVTYPSPFNPLIEYSNVRAIVNKDAICDVYILDLAGYTVKKLENINLYSGINEIEWDGRNTGGDICNNGVYTIVIKANSGDEYVEKHTKLMLIKGGE